MYVTKLSCTCKKRIKGIKEKKRKQNKTKQTKVRYTKSEEKIK
jgi:hypothetical protein